MVDAFYHQGMLQPRFYPHADSIVCCWAILRNGQRVSPAQPVVYFDKYEQDRYERSVR